MIFRMQHNKLVGLIMVVSLMFLGCGSGKDLSRSKAAQMIKEALQNADNKKEDHKTWGYSADHVQPGQKAEVFLVGGGANSSVRDAHVKLEQQGFLQIVPQKSGYLCVKFTNKAKPYVLKEERKKEIFGSGEEVIISVSLADVDKVEVTGISKPSDGNMRGATFKAYYKPNPFGALLLKPDELTREGEMPFTLYDDGWRIGM